MNDLIAALVSLLLTGPLQSTMEEKLAAARAPQAVVSQVSACASTAAPVVVERVLGDPWWAVTTVVRVWTGLADPEAVLLDAAPACRPAIEAARPFLRPSI